MYGLGADERSDTAVMIQSCPPSCPAGYLPPILRGSDYKGPSEFTPEATYGAGNVPPILQGGASATGPNAGGKGIPAAPGPFSWTASPLPLILLGVVGVWLVNRNR